MPEVVRAGRSGGITASPSG